MTTPICHYNVRLHTSNVPYIEEVSSRFHHVLAMTCERNPVLIQMYWESYLNATPEALNSLSHMADQKNDVPTSPSQHDRSADSSKCTSQQLENACHLKRAVRSYSTGSCHKSKPCFHNQAHRVASLTQVCSESAGHNTKGKYVQTWQCTFFPNIMRNQPIHCMNPHSRADSIPLQKKLTGWGT
jgi:hypothetical protein